MAVTDLTNTTWYVPSGWSATAGYGSFYYHFEVYANGSSNPYYAGDISIGYAKTGTQTANTISFDGFRQYDSDDTLILKFANGTYTSLISWLETNGTQLKVTDLTDTTWNVPAGWEAEAGYGRFSLTGTLVNYGLDITNMYIGYEDTPSSDTADDLITFVPYFTPGNVDLVLAITGGTDTTNPELIAWLSQYGELQEEDKPTSDIKPVYLRKNGAWVKQDAYERQNGE